MTGVLTCGFSDGLHRLLQRCGALVTVAFLSASAVSAGAAPASSSPETPIQFLEEKLKADPDDFVAANLLTSRYLQQARETGDYRCIGSAAAAVEASLRAAPPQANISGLLGRARVELAQHRFAEAVSTGKELVRLAPDKPFSHAALGDALLESGELVAARASFDTMKRLDAASVDTLARLARLGLVSGDLPVARRNFDAALIAAKDLSPSSPGTVAWCEVQIGEIAFTHGDWTEAGQRYRAALDLLPGYFPAIDHNAELLAARGEYEAALRIFEPLATRLDRPDLAQVVGDILAAAGRNEEAKTWHDRALSGYLESVGRGELQFGHHLANFFSDVRVQPAEAMKYARKDLEIRHTAAAHDTMAWALYRAGDFPAAAMEIEQALAVDAQNPHFLFQAGMIFPAAGDLERGQRFLRDALAQNPKYNAFHLHR